MKATEQYFSLPFNSLYKVVLTFESVDENRATLQMKATEYELKKLLSCSAVHYTVQGGSNPESVDEILKCDHSNESHGIVQGGSNF